jgi:N-carbamoylputrescine amidase
MTRTVRVGAVQLQATAYDIETTLGHAEELVVRAVGAGAQLVVLPELFTGYIPNFELWRIVEPTDGPTPTWLKQQARRLGIHLGGGYAAWDRDDVMNVYAVARPDGTLAGVAQKTDAEAFIFRRGLGRHVIDTELGRIGVGICADCQSLRVLRAIQGFDVDLVLMPHASPVAAKAGGKITDDDIRTQHDQQVALPVTWSRSLGVPAVFVNQVGPFPRMTGILGSLMDPALFRMQGNSRIVDADGTVLASLDAEEGVAVGDVVLDPARRVRATPKSYGGWLTPGNPIARRVLIPLDIVLGTVTYRLRSRTRREAAAMAAVMAGSAPKEVRHGEGLRRPPRTERDHDGQPARRWSSPSSRR